MGKSKIEWTDETLQLLTGCSVVSTGCKNCYAARTAFALERGRGVKKSERYAGTTHDNGNWTGRVLLLPEQLTKMLSKTKPRRIFLCSMSDLFHEDVPASYIRAVLGLVAMNDRI